MFNVVTGAVGDAQAVLVRAAEPLDDWHANLSGPGRLARGMEITRSDNGLDLTGNKLYVITGSAEPIEIARSPRIGVDYAGDWKDELLRFYDPTSPAVSKVRPALIAKRPKK